jgi:predicted nucleic acid-binding protein
LSGWLIDTNVLSELRRPRPSQKVRAFINAQSGDVLYSSDVIFAEIRFGIEQMDDPERRADLARWLDRTLRPLFAGRVLSVTEDVLLRWRLMLEGGRRKGQTFSDPDLLIAALAAQAGLIVVSRDTRPFAAAGVPAFDPWAWTLHTKDRALELPDADAPDALSKAAALLAN